MTTLEHWKWQQVYKLFSGEQSGEDSCCGYIYSVFNYDTPLNHQEIDGVYIYHTVL